MTDRVLLDENGCYSDDLVDVLFSETARKYGTQTAQLSLAYKLSALDNKGESSAQTGDSCELRLVVGLRNSIRPHILSI